MSMADDEIAFAIAVGLAGSATRWVSLEACDACPSLAGEIQRRGRRMLAAPPPASESEHIEQRKWSWRGTMGT